MLLKGNFQQAIQMQLSKQPKIVYEFLIAILESSLNFQHFEKMDEPQAQVIPKLLTRQNVVT